jgi:single-stranded-DNA-specific exonuclease
LHPVLQRILLARGVRDATGLELGLAQMLPPQQLGGLPQAAQRLADAVKLDQHILVVGDFDADGATGTCLAVKALQAMGARQVDFAVPNRFEFGYGLTPGLVETLRESPPDLLITVDSGIACLPGVRLARQLGIDVVVTDHHLPGPGLPEALAIVNPNCPGDEFPSKNLAGVGVVFYLMGALRSELRQRGWFSVRRPEPNLAAFLDLVALGTVADVVPLDRNNRILVQQGLQRIRAGQASPGLLALLRVANKDYRRVVASDLGFTVGPRLNAAGRLEDMSVGIRCLLSDDREQALALAETLDNLNVQRRNLQQSMTDEAEQQVREQLAQLPDEPLFSLCLFDQRWHQGIVGLVAARIKEARHCPVVVFAPEGEQGGLKGSARSIQGLHIRDVLAHVDACHPGLITAFGGHAMAAGLGLERSGLERFSVAFDASVRHFMGEQPPSAEYLSDGELQDAELDLPFARALRELGPWGQRFEEPVFDGVFELLDQRVLGGAHLKMIVRQKGGQQPLDAIAFRTLPEQFGHARHVRLLYRLDVNHFRGEESAQLMVERIEAA